MYAAEFQRRRPRGPAGGLDQLPFDHGNRKPLPYNSRICPVESGGEPSQKRKRINMHPADSIQTLSLDSPPMDLGMSGSTAWATAMNKLRMAPLGIAGDPLLPDFDPAFGMMTGIPPINPMMPGLGMVPPPFLSDMPVVKEIIHCKSCTLFPPHPNLSPPATRERPPGCKTVFVGGLPENATEETIEEIFEQCGEITSLRKRNKHFCHIRFAAEDMVDRAIYLSGYHIRLGSSTDKKDTGRLHVDFAQAREDLYEWDCKQRFLAREERLRRRMVEERFHPPSPPPVAHFSDHDCSIIAEKLKDDSKFMAAAQTLVTRIERGDVNRRSANNFYCMIQSVTSHIRRLTNEKAAHEKEMEEAKEKFKLALSGILAQFEQIVAVYHSASKQKAWDHFTKAQRKNISVWCKQAEEMCNINNDELMGIRREEEMEMSDDDTEPPVIKQTEESALISQTEALKEENDSLRCQLDAYRNEVELLKQEQSKMGCEGDTSKDQQLMILQQAMQGMQQHLLKLQDECERRDADLEKTKEEKMQLKKLLETLMKKQEAASGLDEGKDSAEHQDHQEAASGLDEGKDSAEHQDHDECERRDADLAKTKEEKTQLNKLLETLTEKQEAASGLDEGKDSAEHQDHEICNINNDELMGIRREEEMEMSDDDIEPTEIKETEESALISQTEALKEENDSLRYQLDAYRNEVELLKQEQSKMGCEGDTSKDQQLMILQQAMQSMQQPNSLPPICSVSQEKERMLERGLSSSPVKSEREALLVGIISTFLHIHPFGASIEYICSYLQRLDSKICASEVETLMTRLQHTFKQEMSGVGASLEKRWKFCGFEGLKTTT